MVITQDRITKLFKPKSIKKNMEEVSSSQIFADVNTRIRDLEEKQRLTGERALLLGKSLVEEREKNFTEIQNMKKILLQLKEETDNLKRLTQRMAEQFSNTARKEELMILQRQFDLFREK